MNGFVDLLSILLGHCDSSFLENLVEMTEIAGHNRSPHIIMIGEFVIVHKLDIILFSSILRQSQKGMSKIGAERTDS